MKKCFDNAINLVSSHTIKSVAKVVSGNIVTNIVTVLSGIFVARWTSPYDMGIWNTALLVTAYTPVLQLGVINGLNRELPYLIGSRDTEKAQVAAQTAYAWVIALIAFTLISTAVGSLVFLLDGQNVVGYTVATIGIVVSCSWASLYFSTTYRTHSEFGRLARNTSMVALVGGGLTLLVLHFGYTGILLRASFMAMLGVAALYVHRPMPVLPVWNKSMLKHLSRVGVPIWLVGQLDSFLISFDRLSLAKSPQLLGYFTIAILVGSFVRSITLAFSIVLYPQMAHRYGENHSAMAVWEIAKRGALAASALGLVVGICGWLLVPPFVEILLPRYVPGVEAAQWASFLGLTTGLCVFDNVYNVIGKQKIYFGNWLIGVAVFWGAWFILTRSFEQPQLLASAQSMLLATATVSIRTLSVSRRACLVHDNGVSLA